MILFYFFLFLVKPLIVGTRSNRLSEVSVRTSTHNLCFWAEIRKQWTPQQTPLFPHKERITIQIHCILPKRIFREKILIPFLFLLKSFIVGTRSKRLSNRLAEAVWTSTHNFYSRNKEIMNSPATLTFSYIKWGLPGYSLHRLVFLMYNSDHLWLFTITIVNYQN